MPIFPNGNAGIKLREVEPSEKVIGLLLGPGTLERSPVFADSFTL